MFNKLNEIKKGKQLSVPKAPVYNQLGPNVVQAIKKDNNLNYDILPVSAVIDPSKKMKMAKYQNL